MRDEGFPAESLRLLPGFARLPARLIDTLARGMLIEQLPAKAVLVEEGETPKALCVLIEGLLQQFGRRGAQETTFAIVSAPALVQPHMLYRDSAASVSFRTVRASCVGRIAMSHARRLLADEPRFAAAITDHIIGELEGVFGEYRSFRERTGLQRLAAWIVAMQRNAGVAAQLTLPFDKVMLAARLGVAPATLSRDFAALEHYGVRVHGRALTIEDPDRLCRLAQVGARDAPPVP